MKRAGSVGGTENECSRVSFGVAGILVITETSGIFSGGVGGVGSSVPAEIVASVARSGRSMLLKEARVSECPRGQW